MREQPKKSKKPLLPEDTPKALSGMNLGIGLSVLLVAAVSGIFVTSNLDVQGYGPQDYLGVAGLTVLGLYLTIKGLRHRKEK
jgi:hypothetical protein